MTASALTRPGERDRLPVKLSQIDWRLTALLCVIGAASTAMLYSVAGASWEPWAANHLMRFGFAVMLMIGLALLDLRIWFAVAYPFYGVTLLMLLAVEVVGVTVNGAQSWIDLGITRVQPAEFMKLAVVLALARWYHGATAQEARLHWKLVFPAAMVGLPFVLVAHQPDLGTAMSLALTGAAIMFVAGLSWKIIAPIVIAAVVAIPPYVMFGMHEYQRKRVLTFLDPSADPSGDGYNIIQSKIALGSGGLLGKGYGLGSQSQLEFLPERHTDFIFATVAEEFGFVGSVAILVCYLAIVLTCLRIASLSHSHFARLAALGVTATFAVYLLINGAMVMGLAPVVGVPMPLMSYGGSMMLMLMVGFGLIQAVRVHRYTELPKGSGLI